MSRFHYKFSFLEDTPNPINGDLILDEPLAYDCNAQESGFYRPGRITLDNQRSLELILYHNQATAKFIYLREGATNAHLMQVIGVPSETYQENARIFLPGQLCLGSERSSLIDQAMTMLFKSPVLAPLYTQYQQENLAIFPIAREGLKYQVADAIYRNSGFYCDEIVLDAHHVFDSSVPVYNRSVEVTLFKDKDLDLHQKENINVAFFADSIASGLVMKEVISRVRERFEHLQHVELITPLATVRGLCRLLQATIPPDCQVRVHVFETLLNALPPDYYFSSHFADPGFHIRPDLEKTYREWWGEDSQGNIIADTACAGYGWSEVFYSPRKQIQMMNSQLFMRHELTIADIVQRNLDPK